MVEFDDGKLRDNCTQEELCTIPLMKPGEFYCGISFPVIKSKLPSLVADMVADDVNYPLIEIHIGDWVRVKNHKNWQKVIALKGSHFLHEGMDLQTMHEDRRSDVEEVADPLRQEILDSQPCPF